ncbi:hypothetical protein ABBQ32_008747 [Trebouxia sp. C0010 RCD-2024]
MMRLRHIVLLMKTDELWSASTTRLGTCRTRDCISNLPYLSFTDINAHEGEGMLIVPFCISVYDSLASCQGCEWKPESYNSLSGCCSAEELAAQGEEIILASSMHLNQALVMKCNL